MKERIVCVEWKDASYNSGFYDKDKPSRYTPVNAKTIGYLIKQDKVAVVLSVERFYDDDGDLDDERHIHTIPKKVITKIRYLKDWK